jgi:hypothetical protein
VSDRQTKVLLSSEGRREEWKKAGNGEASFGGFQEDLRIKGEVGLAGGSFACVDRDWLARQKAMQELGLQGPGAVGGRRGSGEGHFAPGTSLPILTKTSLGRYLVLGVAVRES